MANDSIDSKIIALAAKDSAFRKRLIADPQATLEKEFGLKLPPGVKLQVHEEGESVRHLVLPKAPSKQAELSDDQLEAAAGGLRPASGGSGCCCTCGSSTHQSIYNSNGPTR